MIMSSFLFSKLSVIIIVCVVCSDTTPPCDVRESPSAAATVNILFKTTTISDTTNEGYVKTLLTEASSGVLITESWILTSASTVHDFNWRTGKAEENPQESFKAVAMMGSNSYNSTIHYGYDVQFRVISRGEMYDKYAHGDKFEIRYNIGLFYTLKPFNIIKNVRIAKLPPTRDFTSSCSDTQNIGMFKYEGDPQATTSSKIYCNDASTILDIQECTNKFNSAENMKFDDSMLCLSTAGGSSCAAPDGVPVFCQDGVLIGVTSSYGCGPYGHFLVTRVDSYFSFIAKNTGIQLPSEAEPSGQLINVTGEARSEDKESEQLKNDKRTVPKRNSSGALIGDVYYHISLLLLSVIMCILRLY